MTKHANTDFTLRPLMAIHTSWHAPWLLTALAEHGEHHFDSAEPMQDSHVLTVIGPHIVMAVADGMSSAACGAQGSHIAVSAAVACLKKSLSDETPNETHIVEAFHCAHNAIGARAQLEGRATHDYASTLAVAVLTVSHIAAGSIGDSSILAYTETGADKTHRLAPFVSAPLSTRGRTYSISESYWAEHAAYRASSYPALKGLVVSSDGGNSSFSRAHEGQRALELDTEFLDAIPTLLDEIGPRRLALYWAGYLSHQASNDHDDRTLLVAYRPDSPLNLPAV